MKKILFTLAVIGVVLLTQSCDKGDSVVAEFEDMERQTIYDYIIENPNEYSKFLKILQAGDLDKTVSAYNPDGNNYTMFLPHNEAIDLFIDESERFSSIDELLNDKAYVQAMARY
ncbi:MAG TPA: fasciclin domain-containing protein, partial [Bacteroidales bacterium]|nr:fasciclin domain-containing protein [Bacteroidales bacterium]